MATLHRAVDLGKDSEVHWAKHVGTNYNDYRVYSLDQHLRSVRFTQNTRSGQTTNLHGDFDTSVPTLKTETANFTGYDKGGDDDTSVALKEWALALDEEMRPIIISPDGLVQGSKPELHWMCAGTYSASFQLGDVQMFEQSAMTGGSKIAGTLRSTLLAEGEHPFSGTPTGVVALSNAAGYLQNTVLPSATTEVTPAPANRDNGSQDVPVFWRVTSAANIGHIDRVQILSYIGAAGTARATRSTVAVGSHGIVFCPSTTTHIGFNFRSTETLAANAADDTLVSLSMTFGWIT